MIFIEPYADAAVYKYLVAWQYITRWAVAGLLVVVLANSRIFWRGIISFVPIAASPGSYRLSHKTMNITYQTNSLHWQRSLITGIALATALLLAGCGSSGKGKVSGTVTAAGQPVTGGSVSFAPVAGSGAAAAGRVATGAVRSDGTFSLSTDADNDGALIGLHEVVYTPPSVGGESADPAAKSPYHGLVPRERQVEVKTGENTFAIELVPEQPAP